VSIAFDDLTSEFGFGVMWCTNHFWRRIITPGKDPNKSLEETNMNLNKRFFLITTMAVVIFAAIALGPAYRRTVNAHAKSAVVVLTCTDAGGTGLDSASTSDPSVTLPTGGTPCAAALQDIISQGFSIFPATTNAGSNNYPNSNVTMPVWTLVRPSQWPQ
jgi:hypothetical protein